MADSLALYVKTRYFNGDRRVERETESLQAHQFDVKLFVASDDKIARTPQHAVSIQTIWAPGGAAPAPKLTRIFGAAVFCLHSALLAAFFHRKTHYHWVCDPVLFPLVILLKLSGNKVVVWDHHELPPDWIYRSSLLRRLFTHAYQRADIVVHTNAERRAYLENKIKLQAKRSWLLPNYPRRRDMISGQLPQQAQHIQEFVYLQNTVGEHRCDIEVFSAIKRSGLKVVYAGHVDETRHQFLQQKLNIDSFCTFVGHLSLSEINSLLERCRLTLIFYKKLSTNNWLCEPNRLYQAMNKHAVIVTGNNPIFTTLMAEYPYGVAANTDGSNEEAIYQAIQEAMQLKPRTAEESTSEASFVWENVDDIFKHIRTERHEERA